MKKAFLLILVLLVGLYAFYFFTIRPRKIIDICNVIAGQKNQSDPTITYGAYFKKCLSERGLKNYPMQETWHDFIKNK